MLKISLHSPTEVDHIKILENQPLGAIFLTNGSIYPLDVRSPWRFSCGVPIFVCFFLPRTPTHTPTPHLPTNPPTQTHIHTQTARRRFTLAGCHLCKKLHMKLFSCPWTNPEILSYPWKVPVIIFKNSPMNFYFVCQLTFLQKPPVKRNLAREHSQIWNVPRCHFVSRGKKKTLNGVEELNWLESFTSRPFAQKY